MISFDLGEVLYHSVVRLFSSNKFGKVCHLIVESRQTHAAVNL
jgi:hypothetical protein